MSLCNTFLWNHQHDSQQLHSLASEDQLKWPVLSLMSSAASVKKNKYWEMAFQEHFPAVQTPPIYSDLHWNLPLRKGKLYLLIFSNVLVYCFCSSRNIIKMMSSELEDTYNKQLLWKLNNSAMVLNQLEMMFIAAYALLLWKLALKHSVSKQEKI